MSYTILSSPTTQLQSAGNDCYFGVSSSNVLAPNIFDYQYTANILVNGTISATQNAFPDVN